MSRREKALSRHPQEAMIGGVCAGLASYFDVDTTLVRAVFVAATLMSGFGAVLYLLLWLMLDATPATPAEPPPPPDAATVVDGRPAPAPLVEEGQTDPVGPGAAAEEEAVAPGDRPIDPADPDGS
jgi:phage shock protein C